MSAKKAVRSSQRKKIHNLSWKKRYKNSIKDLSKSLSDKDDAGVLKEKLEALQKVLDKSSKEKVIHKNKANRLKSKYAHKISDLVSKTTKKKATA